MNIQAYTQNKHVQNFVRDIQTLQNKKRPAFLISFNVSTVIESFKVYYEIDRQYNSDEVCRFLPTERDFFKFMPYWNPARESSLCFGKKITKDFVPIDYFHIKFDPHKKVYADYHEFKKPAFVSKNYDLNSETGVSFEYMNGVKQQKNYFYYRHPLDKIYISDKFNISCEGVDHFEYTEFANKSKIISVHDNNFNKNNDVEEFLFSLKNKVVDELVDHFKKHYNLAPEFFGVYKGGEVVAIYWSLTARPDLQNTLFS